jgi:hypothetical protein
MDNFSIIRGRHSVRFGGELRRDRYNQLAIRRRLANSVRRQPPIRQPRRYRFQLPISIGETRPPPASSRQRHAVA